MAFCFKYSVGLEYPEYRGQALEKQLLLMGDTGFTFVSFCTRSLDDTFGGRRQKPWNRLNYRMHLSLKFKMVTRLFFGALFFWSCTFAFPCAAYDPLKGHGKAGPMWRVLLALGLAVCDGEDERRWVSLLFVEHSLLIWGGATNNIFIGHCQTEWDLWMLPWQFPREQRKEKWRDRGIKGNYMRRKRSKNKHLKGKE